MFAAGFSGHRTRRHGSAGRYIDTINTTYFAFAPKERNVAKGIARGIN
jgi:hypothetical protein